ncbi:unnamed protein product, partial [Thlaspi arvense]
HITSGLRPLHIIWDWEYCPIPYSTSAKGLYDKVSSFFKAKNYEVCGFEGFGDTNKLNHSKYDELQKEGKIILHHIDKSEARLTFLQSLCDMLPPSPLVIITGNRNFLGIFQALKERKFGIGSNVKNGRWEVKKRKALRMRREREAEAETASGGGAPEAEEGETSEDRKKAKMVKSENEEDAEM